MKTYIQIALGTALIVLGLVACSKPAPDANRLKADLIGQTFEGFPINTPDSIESFDIRDSKTHPNLVEYTAAATFNIPSATKPLPATLKLVYRLDSSEWRLASLTEDGTMGKALEADKATQKINELLAHGELISASAELSKLRLSQPQLAELAALNDKVLTALKKNLRFQPNEKFIPMKARSQALTLLAQGRIPLNGFVEEVAQLIAIPDDEASYVASRLLSRHNPDRLRQEVPKVVDDASISLQQKLPFVRVAWQELQEPVAGKFLIGLIAQDFLKVDASGQAIEAADRNLREFPYSMTKNIYAKCLDLPALKDPDSRRKYDEQYRIEAFAKAIERAEDRTAGPQLAELLRRQVAMFGPTGAEEILKIIAKLKATEARPAVIESFNHFLSISSNGDYGHREALAALDNDDRWLKFSSFNNGGWPQWDTVTTSIEDMARPNDGSPYYDPFANSSNPTKRVELVRLVATPSPKDEYERMRFSELPNVKVEALSPISVKLETELGYRSNPLYIVRFTLRDGGDEKYPWIVDDLEIKPK